MGDICDVALAFVIAARAVMICGDSPSVRGAEAAGWPFVFDGCSKLGDCGS